MNPESPSKRQPFAWRAMTSVLITVGFLVLVVSGVILFVSPPGRIANWTNWSLLGMRKHEWIGIHICFSLLFLLGALIHVYFNWRPLLGYFKNRMTRQMGFRREWLVALLIGGGVFAGTRLGAPPFSTLLTFNEQVKESWDQPQERAPVPHAELLTLAELAEKGGLDMTTASNRLLAAGVKGIAPDMQMANLAELNGRSAQQLFNIITVPSKEGNPGHSQGTATGTGKGGGPGRKTLAEYCAEEGIELKEALSRLHARGIKAAPDQTMREIAVNNGYSRPYELLELLRFK